MGKFPKQKFFHYNVNLFEFSQTDSVPFHLWCSTFPDSNTLDQIYLNS